MRQQLRDLDDVVERIGADHADLACHRIERFDAAGERAGMRHRRLPAAFRLAELERDDMLARGTRVTAGGLELVEVGDRLDIDDDDFQLRLVGEERDVVRHRQSGFVAAGDEIFGGDAAFLQAPNW